MIELVAVVPARGGSRGVKRKNLALVAGRPMFLWACEAAAEVASEVLVCTDDPEISSVAASHGYVVLERPPRLSQDDVTVDEVVGWVAEHRPGVALLVIQPTVPQVTADKLTELIGDGSKAATLARTATHLRFGDDRVNRQQVDRTLISDELVGVRFYPPGVEDFGVFDAVVQCDYIDVDTTGDLAAVRQAMSRRVILFQALSSPDMGAGHVTRCLAIADQLQHHDIVFDAAALDDWGRSTISDSGYSMTMGGVESFEDVALLVRDALDSNTRLMGLAKEWGAKVVTLEDQGEGALMADLVINAMYPHPSRVCNQVIGSDWAVIRPEFIGLPPKDIAEDALNVLVSFGGRDPAGLTLLAVRALSDRGLYVKVVTPPGRTGATLVPLAQKMMDADLLITSGGRTVFEAAAVGIPTVVMAQNVRELRHGHLGWPNGNLMMGLGALCHIEDIAKTVGDVLRNRELRADMSQRGRSLVDGRGALRIARRIEGLLDGT